MSTNIVAACYALLAIAIPFGGLPRLFAPDFLARAFAIWAVTALLLFFLDDYLFILALAAIFLAVLAPSDPAARIGFFFIAVPCLPVYMIVHVPFPGINWLILLSYYKVVVLVVLVPLLFRELPGERHSGLSAAGICLALYIAMTTILVTASTADIVGGGRFFIDQILLYAIPFIAISRTIRRKEDLELCLRAILLVCLVLGSITLVSTFKQWDFYRLKAPPSVFTIPDERAGFVRIEATANTHSLGYHLALGIIILEYLKSRIAVGWIRLWGMRFALLGGIYFTNSRGALLGLIAAFLAYFVVRLKSKILRRGIILAGITGAIFGGIWLATADVSKLDPHGTVGYRQLLLSISIEHILANPLIGDLGFTTHPRFGPLLQGQGIVDITNLYLQIGLAFGLVALALFMGVFVSTLLKLMRGLARGASDAGKADLRRMAALLLGATVGWFVLIATTSDVGLTIYLGVILASLGRATVAFGWGQHSPLPGRSPTVTRYKPRPIGHTPA